MQCQYDFPSSTSFPLDDNRQHYNLGLQPHNSSESLDSPYSALQQTAPQTSRIVITTKNVDPSFSYVKEVDVGNTVISYVPHNVVFSEDPDFFDTVHDVVHVKCFQTDINFSMAFLCKPQDLPENCLVVWAVDEKVRQNAMWSSPEHLKVKEEKLQTSAKVPWFRSKSASKEQLLHLSPRGPAMTEPLYQGAQSGSKKYQGRVPSIVALLTHHAKSHHKVQKTAPQPEKSILKAFQDGSSENEYGVWQQNRFAPVSREIHKALAAEEEEITDKSVRQMVDDFDKGTGYGFSYHLSPSTRVTPSSRPSVLNIPPPPQMPLPPVPEAHDYSEPQPGPSSRRDSSPRLAKPSVTWKQFQSNTASKVHRLCQPVAYRAQRLSESVTFLNPYTQKAEYEAATEEKGSSQIILTPHSEKQRRESTSLFLPDDDDLIKPKDIDQQKLSTVLVLSLFVIALIIFYLVYFL